MTGYLIAFVFGIFIMGALIAQRDKLGSGGFNAWLRAKKGLAVLLLLAVVAVALLVQSLVTVQAGTVGVVKRLGAVRQEFNPGLHVIVPFIDKVVIFPTLKKNYEASDNPQSSEADYPDIIVSALTSDGQQIKVGLTARFMIAPGKAAWILQNLGSEREYVEKVVKTEIRGSGRRVPTRFAAYDLYTKKSYEAQQSLFDEIAPKFEAERPHPRRDRHPEHHLHGRIRQDPRGEADRAGEHHDREEQARAGEDPQGTEDRRGRGRRQEHRDPPGRADQEPDHHPVGVRPEAGPERPVGHHAGQGHPRHRFQEHDGPAEIAGPPAAASDREPRPFLPPAPGQGEAASGRDGAGAGGTMRCLACLRELGPPAADGLANRAYFGDSLD